MSYLDDVADARFRAIMGETIDEVLATARNDALEEAADRIRQMWVSGEENILCDVLQALKEPKP